MKQKFLSLTAVLIAVTMSASPSLAEEPELVNTDPYGEGWFVELSSDAVDLAGILDAEAYRGLTETD